MRRSGRPSRRILGLRSTEPGSIPPGSRIVPQTAKAPMPSRSTWAPYRPISKLCVFDSLLDSARSCRLGHSRVGEIGSAGVVSGAHGQNRNDVVCTLMTQTKSPPVMVIRIRAWRHQPMGALVSKHSENRALVLRVPPASNDRSQDGQQRWGRSLNHLDAAASEYVASSTEWPPLPADNSVAWNVINFAPIVVGDLTSASSQLSHASGLRQRELGPGWKDADIRYCCSGGIKRDSIGEWHGLHRKRSPDSGARMVSRKFWVGSGRYTFEGTMSQNFR